MNISIRLIDGTYFELLSVEYFLLTGSILDVKTYGNSTTTTKNVASVMAMDSRTNLCNGVQIGLDKPVLP